jgi:hypothetical protein
MFATRWGLGDSKAEAYRQAYDIPPDCTSNWIYPKATVLSKQDKVKVMADDVRQAAQTEILELSGFTRGKAWEQSQRDHALAHAEKQAGAASTATKLSATIAGHLDDSTPADKALVALGELMASIAKAGGDAPTDSDAPGVIDITPSTKA